MARDDEFRKVAEDVRALARSLARDFRSAVDQSRQGGSTAGRAVRRGLRDVADEARRGVKETLTGSDPSSGSGSSPASGRSPGWGGPPWGCSPGWGRPPRWARPPRGVRNGRWFPPAPSAGAPGSPSGAPAGGVRPAPPAPTWHRPPHRNRRPRLPPVRHRWDATTVLGMLAVLFGTAWLLGVSHAVHVSAEAVIAVGLMLLGASLVVTARTDWSLSRRSWPVWAGVALIAALVATSTTFGLGSSGSGVSFGNRNVTVASSGETVNGGFGNLSVDAAGLKGGGTVHVSSIAGEVRVTVPADAEVRLNARLLAGRICLDGKDVANGVGASNSPTLQPAVPPPSGPAPVLNLDVHESFGQILVGTRGLVECRQ